MSCRLISCAVVIVFGAHSYAHSAGNPASAYCEEVGGINLTVESDEGQLGVCLLPDGGAIDSWSLFRSKTAKRKAEAGAAIPESEPESCDPEGGGVSWLNMRDCVAKDAADARANYAKAHNALTEASTDAALSLRVHQVDLRFRSWREAQCRVAEEIAMTHSAPQGVAYFDCLAGIDKQQAELLEQIADQ